MCLEELMRRTSEYVVGVLSLYHHFCTDNANYTAAYVHCNCGNTAIDFEFVLKLEQ